MEIREERVQMGGRIRQAHLDETTEVLNAIVMCALPSISAIKKVVPTTGLEPV